MNVRINAYAGIGRFAPDETKSVSECGNASAPAPPIPERRTMRIYEVKLTDGNVIQIDARNWIDAIWELDEVLELSYKEIRDITIPSSPVGVAGDA